MKYNFLIAVIFSLLLFSCKKEGCTDFSADNYDEKAKTDDGSCHYSGCTDPDAGNYNPKAETDDGSCTYPGSLKFYSNLQLGNGYFIDFYSGSSNYWGKLQSTCTDKSPDCDASCKSVEITDLDPGFQQYHAYYIYQTSGDTYDTIQVWENQSALISSNECTAVKITR